MSLPLAMEYHRKSGRYTVWNGTDALDPGCQTLRFPNEEVIALLWEEHCPGKSFAVASDISEPVPGFWADVGKGSTPQQRRAFCEALQRRCKTEGFVPKSIPKPRPRPEPKVNKLYPDTLLDETKLKTGAEWELFFTETVIEDPKGWYEAQISITDDPITLDLHLKLRSRSTVHRLLTGGRRSRARKG